MQSFKPKKRKHFHYFPESVGRKQILSWHQVLEMFLKSFWLNLASSFNSIDIKKTLKNFKKLYSTFFMDGVQLPQG